MYNLAGGKICLGVWSFTYWAICTATDRTKPSCFAVTASLCLFVNFQMRGLWHGKPVDLKKLIYFFRQNESWYDSIDNMASSAWR